MTPIQKRMYFLQVHSKMPRGEKESLYSWTGRVGLSRSTAFGIFNKGNGTMHNSVASKIATATGADEIWIQNGVGEPYSASIANVSAESSQDNKIESEGLTITTAIDKAKLQQAFETTEQALHDQHKSMKPDAKAEFIVMLYTALTDSHTQNFDKLLNTAIYLVENELSSQRRTMSQDKKTLLIIAIYTLYIDNASNVEALELSIKNLIRSAA
ncbi:hypothetical protein ACFSHO_03595 [Acinetobacter vivianii]